MPAARHVLRTRPTPRSPSASLSLLGLKVRDGRNRVPDRVEGWRSARQGALALRRAPTHAGPRPRGALWRLLVTMFAMATLLSACGRRSAPAELDASDETGGEPQASDLWTGVPALEADPELYGVMAPKAGPPRPETVAEEIEAPFPPPAPPTDEGASEVVDGPLHVLRHGPEGAVAIVDALRVAFDQPMVPLTSIENLKGQPIPMQITPLPPGEFRWMGTRALAFVPEGRLPYSTTFDILIPKGTKSALGNALDADHRWSIVTPGLALERSQPRTASEQIPLEQDIVLVFNQRVKPELADAIRLSAGGNDVPLRALTEGEWKDLKGAWVDAPGTDGDTRRSRTLVLRPTQALSADTAYKIAIPAGTWGEGPDRSSAITVGFRTYPPLRLGPVHCATTYDCSPESGLVVRATTRLADARIADRVSVTPAVEDLEVSTRGTRIALTGNFEGETTYTVTVAPGVLDAFGQETKTQFVGSKRTGRVNGRIQRKPAGRTPAVVEAKADHTLKLEVGGITDLQVMARGFGPDELSKFVGRSQRMSADDNAWPTHLRALPPTHDSHRNVAKSKKRPIGVELELDTLRDDRPFVFINARSEKFVEQDWSYRHDWQEVVQITDLGVVGIGDRKAGYFAVTRLSNGAPVSGATLELWDENFSSKYYTHTTDAQGRARVELDRLGSSGGFLVATLGHEASFIALDSDVDGGWMAWLYANEPKDAPRAFIFTEREPHKPGEVVHLAGIVREETRGPSGGVRPWGDDRVARYQITSPRGVEIAKGEVAIGPFGTFSLDVPIPADADTGQFSAQFEFTSLFSSSQSFQHWFAVEEYRTPEFAVEVARVKDEPLHVGDDLIAEIRGKYLFGAPLIGADATWTVTRTESFFRPPGDAVEGFTFGKAWSGGWGRRTSMWNGDYGGGGLVVASGAGALDEQGKIVVTQTSKAPPPAPGTPTPKPEPLEVTGPPEPPTAVTLSIAAVITDANRQAISASGSFIIHASADYVGVRTDRTVLAAGDRTRVEAVVVDAQGKRQAGRAVALEAWRKDTKRNAVERDGKWVLETKMTQRKTASCEATSADAPSGCDLDFGEAGTYRVIASVQDGEGRRSSAELTLFVHGDDEVIWEEDERRVDIVADKTQYKPGETAHLLVRSPFSNARGVLVVAREGIAREIPLVIKGGMATVDLPIEEAWLAGVQISAALARGREDIKGVPSGQDLGRPMHATGTLDLDVSTDAERIVVEVLPASDAIAPGESLEVTIKTRSVDGAPIPANVVVMVADEGVLSLMGHTTPDPLAFFHRRRSPEVGRFALHAQVVSREPDQLPPVATMLVPAAEPPAPPSPYGGAFAVGNDDADVWGGLTGTEVGEAYGVGGLGLVGTGRGGGGTGEGTIGLGNTGLIGKGGGGGTGSGYGRGSGAGFGQKNKEASAADRRTSPSDAKPASPSRSVAATRGSTGGEWDASEAQAAAGQAVKLRTFFASTAYYDPDLQISPLGETTIKIPMPENLTSFRIMVVAVDPQQRDRFGHGEGAVRVRKPIMVRPSLPRFANFGDRFSAGVMVDNQTETAQKVLVGVRGANVAIRGADRTMLEIPAGESMEVRFDLATEHVGKMRLQFAAMAPGGRDAASVDVPVLTPATKQAFADYGMTDGTVKRTIDVPKNVLAGFGGLELTFSSTALNGLEDAVDYLVTYRYECAEQTASRILPIFALGPLLDQFPIFEVRDKALRDALANEGIAKLWRQQNRDGGFGFWDDRESWPYLSAWVTFALLEGKRAGFEVDERRLAQALQYLENFVRYGHRTRWGIHYDETTRAFALWLLAGESRGAEQFAAVYAQREDLPLYGRAMLMAAAHRFGKKLQRDELLGELRKLILEDADSIHFAESSSEAWADGLRALMHSSVQTDAIVLTALLEITPEDEETLAKMMAGIMKSRRQREGGRWQNTHTTAWALIAASRYFALVEKDEPHYLARVWLDADFVGEHEFAGRSMTKINQHVPMATLLNADFDALTLAKEGPGKLYYRLGFRYAPADFVMPAVDRGFVVQRTYAAIPEPLPHDATAAQREASADAAAAAVVHNQDGSWRVKAGTNVRVTLTVVAGRRGSYVVVDDPLPAGFEGQNPRFLTSVAAQSVTQRDSGRGRNSWVRRTSSEWWWPWFAFDHTQMRDDRMLLFADHMPAGVYTYEYTARATTLGSFILPPVHAEEMYEPERFGHSASSRVEIVD